MSSFLMGKQFVNSAHKLKENFSKVFGVKNREKDRAFYLLSSKYRAWNIGILDK